jgi:nucleoside-diphosphate-sugar epimerase
MVSVLLTGASGYIGSHLAAALAQTSCKVHAILRPNSNDALLKLYAPQAIIHHYQGNYSNLVSIIEKVKPQLVFHLAASGNYHHQPIDITKITQANLELGMNLLEAMDKVGCRYLINTGTYWQHYTGEHYDPVCLYAATKQAFEAIIDYYVAAKSFNVVTLKLFDVYGPNDPRPKLFNLLFQAAINQQ